MNLGNKKKVLVAMSGGLDSSWAAKLLKDQGYQVLGVFMRLGTKEEDEDKARRVCKFLGIDFYPFNLSQEFKKEVIDYFLKAYKEGYTPNPCVKCNKKIKFNKLAKLADSLGYDYLATGHYVRCRERDGIFYLEKAKDKRKDQSYFLYNLTQKHLSRCLFPLGNLLKEEIRQEAEKIKLPFSLGESQDICFIFGEHNDFLKKHLSLEKGPIKNLKGEVIGEHQGLPLYTIGQRRGVEIGGIGPLYVVETDYQSNILYVTDQHNHPQLFRGKLKVEEVNWIKGEELEKIKCEAVLRYGAKPIKTLVRKVKQGTYRAELEEEVRAVTPGQSAVFYDKNIVLGGGTIKLVKN